MVGRRRRLLDYLQKNDIERYRKIIADLNLRRYFEKLRGLTAEPLELRLFKARHGNGGP